MSSSALRSSWIQRTLQYCELGMLFVHEWVKHSFENFMPLEEAEANPAKMERYLSHLLDTDPLHIIFLLTTAMKMYERRSQSLTATVLSIPLQTH